MDAAVLLIALGALLVLLIVLAVASGRAAEMPRSISGVAEREAAMAAQADVEANDIAEMIEARAALRERIGKRSIGEELGEDALRERSDEAE
jgi:hypothetical protein